jgi:Tol biopolymer transport system component
MKKYSIPKKSLILIAVLISLLITLSLVSNALQNGYDLFQKALAKERGEGNLEEAISLYKKVVDEASDESLAAKAQLRIGICYEKLGRKEAQKAFQKVIDNYPSQTETVKVAKEKLSILMKAQTVIEKEDKEFRIRKVWDYAKMGGSGNMGRPSPDGRYLLYADMGSLNVCALEFATKKKHFITKEKVPSASKEPSSKKSIEFHWGGSIWSPDGKKVAYSWLKFKNVFELNDAWDKQWNLKDSSKELRTIGFDGSNPKVLYSDDNLEAVTPLDWSSDGKFILAEFIRKDKTRQLVTISVAEGSVRVLKTFDKLPRGDGFRIGELFSSDGQHVVFNSQQENSSNRDIFLLSADGNYEVALVEHPADDFVLGWTPDEKSLIFASDRTGTASIWAILVSGGRPHGDPVLIKKDMGSFRPKGFDKKGSFYYAHETTVSDVYIAEIDSETCEILSKAKKASEYFVGSAMYPNWSPDGKYLAYISYPEYEQGALNPKSVIFIRSIDKGKEREIYIELRNIRGTCWSPDGRFILTVGSEKEGREGFYQIDVKTGNFTSILQFNKGDIVGAPVWSQDGKKIFCIYKYPDQKIARIMMFNLASKEKMEIHRDNFQRLFMDGRPFFPQDLALSPDGQFLAFNVRERETLESILKIIPISGGEAREVVRWEKRKIITTADWTPDGKELLFAESKFQRGYKFNFWKISVEGGEPQKLGLQMDRVYILRINPDGQRIAFRAGQRIKEIYAMDNFLPEEKTKKRSK